MKPVVVIGAGPTGLTLSALLARYGVPVTLVERQPEPYPLPRAVHLDDEVYRIVQAAGAAETFERTAFPGLGLRLIDAGGRVLTSFLRDRPLGSGGWPETTMYDQPDLEAALLAAVQAQGLVEIRRGATAVAIDRDGAKVRVRTGDGAEEVLAGSYVAGADGANSLAATVIGTGHRDLRFRQHWLVVDVRCAREIPLWPGVHQVCGGARAETFMRIGPDRYRWEFRRALPDPLSREKIRALLEPRLPVPWDDVEVVRTAGYTHRATVARRWRRGRVLLAGDAAHRTPPFIGQGLGAGQRDAANLAWKLAAVLHGHAPEALLDTYQRERAPHALRTVALASAIGAAMSVPQGHSRRVTDAGLRLVGALPGQRAVTDALLYPPVRRSAANPRRIGGVVGRPFPQAVVDGVRTDELLGTGFATVHSGTPLGCRARAVEAAALGPDIVEWFARHRLAAVLVRPDRVVCAAHRRGRLEGALAPSEWLPTPAAPAASETRFR